jgi:uncharacterized protein YegJ (DUF2314 family)
MKYLNLFFLILIASCNSNTQRTIIAKDSTQVVIVQQDDNEMNTAIFNAKNSLSKFDSALSSKNSDYSSFALKVRFAYDNNGEHIWLNHIIMHNREYIGIVNNQPEYISNLKLGDTIKINKNDISDWMYIDNDILRGAFTIKLLRKRMSEKERMEFDSTSFYKIEE